MLGSRAVPSFAYLECYCSLFSVEKLVHGVLVVSSALAH